LLYNNILLPANIPVIVLHFIAAIRVRSAQGRFVFTPKNSVARSLEPVWPPAMTPLFTPDFDNGYITYSDNTLLSVDRLRSVMCCAVSFEPENNFLSASLCAGGYSSFKAGPGVRRQGLE
jgi:hypothetical protein